MVTCGGGFPEACFVWLSIVGQRRGLAMRTIGLRADYTAEAVRTAAARVCDAAQARRLLAIAAVYDGMNRRDAAKIGAIDRQTPRNWVHRFNAEGPGQPQAA